MRAAGGGGGVVHALALSEPRRKIPAWMWAAGVVSVLLHAGGAYWLYTQKFVGPPAATEEPTSNPVPWIRLTQPRPKPSPAPSHPDARNSIRESAHTPDAKTPPLTVPDLHPSTDGDAKPFIPEGPKLTGGAAGGTGATKTPSVITDPNWLSQPDGDAINRYYPGPAAAAGVEGKVILSCSVTAKGTLAACAIVSETPTGQGFGRAGLHLVPYFRMSPRTVDGQPIDGAKVTIPIRFRL
ncbi:MAG: energy transducer TonB [Proteobacteria bacterium]|nr:energy transducer TonB [Pseudomonadota bacterium]